jgi:DNA-binding XRE family transcriptional regulator
MPLPLSSLIAESRRMLLLNQEQLANLVESSKRTVQRWEVGAAAPAPWHLHKLIDALRPSNPELASQLDAWAPRPASPPPPPSLTPEPPPPVLSAPPAPPPIPLSILVEAVVCAAAEAMNLPPQAVRPAILAAFTRARDTGLSPEAVVAVLAPPEAPPGEETKSTAVKGPA